MAAAAAQISSCLRLHSSVRGICSADTSSLNAAKPPPKFGTVFATGSPLLLRRYFCKRNLANYSKSATVRCEQGSSNQSIGLDLWIGRLAMVSFVTAVTVEIATGKGPLENLGVPTPLPIVALAVAVLVAVLTAYFIFQSASEK